MHFTTLSSQKIKSATWQWLMQARCGCPTLFSGEKKWKVVKILIRRIIYWKPWNILFVCDLCNKVLEIMEVDILYHYIDENFHFQKWKDREVPRDIDSKSLHQGVSQWWCPLQYKVDTIFMIFTEISEENPFRRVWHISSLIKCFLPNLSTKLVLLM